MNKEDSKTTLHVELVAMATPPGPSSPLVRHANAAAAASGDHEALLTSPSQSLYEVEERPYAANPNFTKNASSLKYRWEEAPRGRVFYMRRGSANVGYSGPLSGGMSPRSSDLDAGESSGLLPHQTNYESKDDGQHYTPGVEEHALDELRATSIAGNDISSSCLYATGIVASSAGKYAPFSSVMVCIVLYWFRKIYSEVFSALPMNGGTYNALLNTASKNMAALAAVLSTISYTATAVTSAASAGDYLNSQWSCIPSEWVCIGILIAFALLTLMGIKDSANAATLLFIIHITTMGTLVIGALVHVIRDGGNTLKASWNSQSSQALPHSSVVENLFYGYCSALLGVTGFETSSNYIEEQKPGVFPKTLRNMWIAITLINPALAVLAMGVVPIESLVDNANFSLAAVARVAVGDWFGIVIVVDAALVLAGAVLTSYVGITGMHRRLALDRIMPHLFLDVNKWRKTNHWIIIVFCVLTCSLRLLVNDMNVLGGVYAIAFLGVMSLFCLSNILLKLRRGKLPRSPIAHPFMVILALAMVLLGIGGNLAKDPENGEWFGLYFIVFGIAVVGTKLRVTILRFLVRMVPSRYPSLKLKLESTVHQLRSFPIVFFVKDANLHMMNKAIHYIIENEDTKSIKLVHMERHSGRVAHIEEPSSEGAPTLVIQTPAGTTRDLDTAIADQRTKGSVNCPTPPTNHDAMSESIEVRRRRLEEWCTILDELYPKITIDVLFIDDDFGPSSVAELSQQLDIPRNYMFMTCPSERFNSTIGHLGGVRVIQH